jgi:TatD DNase family protein
MEHPPGLIDTHCHLYLPEFDSDRSLMIDRAQKAGVTNFFLPNIDAASIQPLLSLSDEMKGVCLPMMGLHPCSVKENWEEEISEIESWLLNKSHRWFGIGETGLDYYWDQTFVDRQKENFQRHIDWAKQFHLPIIIHSREALEDCIEMIDQNRADSLRGIFHCFSGTAEQARRITDLGFLLGIGGVVTFKNSGLDKVLPQLDLNQLVLETDSPYLAPAPYRGKRNESSYLKLVTKKISEVLNLPEEKIAEVTTENARNLFGLSKNE